MSVDDIPRWVTDLKFWQQIDNDAKRTLFCSSAVAPWVQAIVDLYDRGDTFTVEVSPMVSDNEVIVADLQAVEAHMARPFKPDFRIGTGPDDLRRGFPINKSFRLGPGAF